MIWGIAKYLTSIYLIDPAVKIRDKDEVKSLESLIIRQPHPNVQVPFSSTYLPKNLTRLCCYGSRVRDM